MGLLQHGFRALLLFVLLASAASQEVLLGDLSELEHDVSGKVYIVDDHTLRIEDFTYDGLGPEAIFWLDEGDSATAGGVGAFLKDDCVVPDKLESANGEEVLVEMPEGKTISDFGYFSVWCRAVASEFGGIKLDLTGLQIPEGDPKCSGQEQEQEPDEEATPVLIGELSELEHDVSGTVFALNNRQLRIAGLTYDGEGPAALFWVGTGERPSSSGQGVPFKDSCEIDTSLPAYNGDTVELELPDGMTLSDIDYLSVWCEAFNADFGSITIDASSLEGVAELSSPQCGEGQEQGTEPFPVPEGWNCEELSEDFQARWLVDGDNIKFELVARDISTDRYMGFGPSGSDTSTNMVGGDVVIAYNTGSEFAAVDYLMSSRQPCNNGEGVCPDTVLANNPGNNDVTGVSGEAEGDLTRIAFTRPLAAADSADRPISTTGETFVVWALGPLDGSDQFLPLFHQGQTNFPPRGTDVSFEFGRTPKNECSNKLMVQEEEEEEVPGFLRPTISNTNEITARIGPPGGARGYAGITGGPGWGFAWYMSPTGTSGEDVLIPAIALEKGETYTFTVQGGTSDEGGAYHPLYITTSTRGGYATISPAERALETVYAGIEDIVKDENGGVVNFTATATGALCDISSSITETDEVETWEEYAASLNVSCAEDPEVINNSGELKFTVPENAPDLLYYQCVTHQFLGFKLVIFDKGQIEDQARLERENGGGELRSEGKQCNVVFNDSQRGYEGCQTLAGGVELFWTLDETKGEIETLFRAPTGGGYVGFGWGYQRMVPGTALVAYQGADGRPVIDNYDMTAQNTAGVQPGDGDEYTGMEAAIDGEFVAGVFTRKLQTDVLPTLINGEVDAIWAIGSQPSSATSLTQHGTQGAVKVNLKTGATSGGGLGTYDTVHAALMIVTWLFLTPTAIVIMRYLKGFNPTSFQLHRAINVLSVLIFTAAYIMGLARGSRAQKAHLGVGSAVFVLAMLQVLGGALRPHKGAANRKPWYMGHFFLGNSAVILAVANCAVGIEKFNAGNSWWIAFGVFIGLNVLAHIVLTVLRGKLPEEKEKQVEKNIEEPEPKAL